MTTVTIRPFAQRDAGAVRDLFIHINRLLAPAALREAFEGYIAHSLAEEIDCIPDYYGERGGAFFVAVEEATVVGMFGLEPSGDDALELRRMYVAPEARRGHSSFPLQQGRVSATRRCDTRPDRTGRHPGNLFGCAGLARHVRRL